MKLLRLKLNQRYKSIDNFDYDFRETNDNFSSFSPICFVGLNGSGKSNIIEALSEIFCYLDLFILDYEHAPKWTKKSPLSFEIEYLLVNEKSSFHLKITCEKGKEPIFYLIDQDGIGKRVSPDNALLPSRIIGYSSGHNESISYPYLKNQGFYANEVAKIAFKDSGTKDLSHTLSLFMDYEVNSLILITNYLFNNNTSIFKDLIRIKQPTCFTINIKLSEGSKRDIQLTQELIDVIYKLQKSSTYPDGDFKKEWKLHFLVNDATKKAIQSLFDTAEDFFTALYKLSLLNALRLTASERNFYTKKLNEDSLKERAPVVPKEKKVFNIDDLKIQLDIPDIEIDYSGLSDGEHQFIHIFGTIMLFNSPHCLFLLDEPESHFNPQWRAKFINLVNEILENNRVLAKLKKMSWSNTSKRLTLGDYQYQLNEFCKDSNYSELILSTHSPYIISAAKKEHVLKFSREADQISYSEPVRETFGAMFEEILVELFNVENSISTYSKKYINTLIENKNLSEMEEAVSNIANSSVKRFLYQEILRLRKAQGS